MAGYRRARIRARAMPQVRIRVDIEVRVRVRVVVRVIVNVRVRVTPEGRGKGSDRIGSVNGTRASTIEVRELYGTMDLTHFISRLAPAFSKFFLQIF